MKKPLKTGIVSNTICSAAKNHIFKCLHLAFISHTAITGAVQDVTFYLAENWYFKFCSCSKSNKYFSDDLPEKGVLLNINKFEVFCSKKTKCFLLLLA